MEMASYDAANKVILISARGHHHSLKRCFRHTMKRPVNKEGTEGVMEVAAVSSDDTGTVIERILQSDDIFSSTESSLERARVTDDEIFEEPDGSFWDA